MRRLNKGQIDKKEFWRRMKINSVTTVGGLAGGAGGATAGFAIGTMIAPGIGSVVGTIIGGVFGGFAGEKISSKAYVAIEEQLKQV